MARGPKTGFVPRGYDYLGPGNDLHRGPPRNANDAVAQDHDEVYTAILEAGGQPYTQWSESDRQFFQNLRVNDLYTAFAKGAFGLKNAGHRLGLLDDADSQSNLRGARRSDDQMARQRLRGETAFHDAAREESMRNNRERGRQGRENEGGTTRRFRTEGTDLEGALIAIGNDPGNDSLLDLPRHPDEDAEDARRVGLEGMEGRTNDAGMDPPGGELALAARSGGGDGPNGQSKETPVSIPPSITYGLQETHTTILPWNGWLSAVNLDYGTAVQIPIAVNRVNDMIPITTGAAVAAGSLFPAKGIYAQKFGANAGRTFNGFPSEFTPGSTDPTEKPSWRDYFFAIYEYYTVIKCHYEIIIHNPLNTTAWQDGSVLCGVQFDSYSDTASSLGNVMPQATLTQAMAYKGMRWERISGQGGMEQQKTDNNMAVINGTWMPGMTKRNIVNDGDVKTWTKTDGSIPNLKEIMTLNFWAHPFANQVAAAGALGVNVQINLKYVVQFKDLKLQARYPNTISAGAFNILQELSNATATGDAYQAPIV